MTASALSTDLYQLTMMAGYFRTGRLASATFELFVRRLPPRRNYLVAAGLEQALEYLEGLRFAPDQIDYLRTVPELKSAPGEFFDDYLAGFRFSGDVYAMLEGTPAFPNEPLVQVVAPLPEAQLVETALLAVVSLQTSVASRATRIVRAARNRPVIEFGARRAHGTEAAALAARASYLAGCRATSNVEAGARWGIPVSGTMAHSWVLAHEREEDAMREYLEMYGEHAVMLVDTYDTLRAVDRIISAGLRPAALRLDSGDLVALARAARAKLDRAGLTHTRLLASGDLDEDEIARLLAAGAPYDGFGVGGAISAVTDAPSLGSVYKLVEIERHGRPRGVMKKSEGKYTLPCRKQVWRVAEGGRARHDVLGLACSGAPPAGGRPLLTKVMDRGRRLPGDFSVQAARDRWAQEVLQLPSAALSLDADANYEVRQSEALRAITERLLAAGS